MKIVPLFLLCFASAVSAAAGSVNVIDEFFMDDAPGAAKLKNWQYYTGEPELTPQVRAMKNKKGNELVIDDCSTTPKKGYSGIRGLFAAIPGATEYRLAISCTPLDGRNLNGAWAQIRFMPSDKFVQKPLQEFTEVLAVPPQGTKNVMIYLYTNYGPTPGFAIQNIHLTAESTD